MSDYSKTTNFTAKDSLTTGDPEKIILGADFDTEFDNISTAVATKYDTTDLASQAEAEAGTSSAKIMTPQRTEQWSAVWAAENGGIVGDLHALADPNADRMLFWDDSAGAAAFLTASGAGGMAISGTNLVVDFSGMTSVTPVGADSIAIYDASQTTSNRTTITNLNAALDHDATTNFVANEHVDHTSVSITPGTGLTGGGDISANRTIDLQFEDLTTLTNATVSVADFVILKDNTASEAKISITEFATKLEATMNHDSMTGFVANEHIDHSSVSVTAGSGLTGGGTIAATRTINIGAGTGITVNADSIQTDDSAIVHDNLSGFVSNEHINHGSVSITAGNGLTGGGTIAATRTIDLDISSLTNMDVSETAATDSILVNDGGTMKQMDIQDMGVRVVTTTAAQTFAQNDANTLQLLTGTTTRDFTIPPNSSVAFQIGTVIYIGSRDTVAVGVDPGSGVTLTSINASGTSTQDISAGGLGVIIKVATDEWMLSGDLA